ncbi:unnamed protein product [marine sediment metagenome]|uniref:Uncharacterized protein n=1 Tax=marine sediment metagenome TaxID=412755 RepID=X1CEX2_9ZZZZ
MVLTQREDFENRRTSGATHSFRLTRYASILVDDIKYPRKLGGKSRKVSDAIEWYFGKRDEEASYDELLQTISFLQKHILQQAEVEPRKSLIRRIYERIMP